MGNPLGERVIFAFHIIDREAMRPESCPNAIGFMPVYDSIPTIVADHGNDCASGTFVPEAPGGMTYEQAQRSIHVRSAMRRKSRRGVLYWKNHELTFDERVPEHDKVATDWEEYDPREHPGSSSFEETPA
jgi:hypothetical protein